MRLAKIDPNDAYPRDVLLDCLSGKDDATYWIAAYAIAASNQKDPRWILPLKSLLRNKDVRVRVAAANAHWRNTGDIATSLPVLVESLEIDDHAFTTAYWYPSNQRRSHKGFAVSAIGSMGPRAKSAIPSVLKVIKDASIDIKQIWYEKGWAGIEALSALSNLGPDAAAYLDEVTEWTSRDGTIYQQYPELTARYVAALKAQKAAD